MDVKSMTEVAIELGVAPKLMSDGFYCGWLDNARVVRIGGRRLIPVEYIPEIREVLIARGRIHVEEAVA